MPVTITGGTLVTGAAPGGQRLLVGSSINNWGPFGNDTAAWNDLENGNAISGSAHVGTMQLSARRVFASDNGSGGFVGTSMPAKQDYGKRVTIYSIKPDFSVLASGSGAAYTAAIGAIDAMLDDTDPSHKVIWVAHHEFNGDYGGSGQESTADFQAGTRAWATRIKNRGNPNWKTGMISTRFGFQTTAGVGQHPDVFWPGPGFIDTFGMDLYNRVSANASQGWDSFSKAMGVALPGETLNPSFWKTLSPADWILQKGIPTFIGELGTMRNHNAGNPAWCVNAGIDPTKDAWIQNAYATMMDWTVNKQGLRPAFLGACYFDSTANSITWAGDGVESWPLWEGLPGDDSHDAMRYVNQTYGYTDVVASGEPTWPLVF